ncbi:DUF3035 domain-containing protein [Pararhodobacter oceanensis]|uniref:DUF3035 domain-containing protein n=1 Tax=Pararhodobacter oceanensis TaxID=2172121 RepID=A0A2T8HRE2_9RHOB|nr:DUF3035 domain-containing protein [Pararhodobacter oceanensis]PVH27912.1 DUF3035 domain-containing protein [Pararhodobacter oceanensis]
MTIFRLCAFALLTILALTACSRSGEGPFLMNAASPGDSPDEFSIVPTAPLEAPPNFSELPTPTPGGSNRVDPDARALAVAALGGRVSAEAGGIPAADAGLVRYAARAGSTEDIRATLAAEDLQFRRNNSPRVLERMFNTNVYRQAYAEQILDPQEELRRWRERGVRTPSAPPPGR